MEEPWYGMLQAIDATNEVTGQSTDLLEAIYNLQHLINDTEDPAKAAEYIRQLNEFKSKLIALGPAAEPLGV